MRLFVADFFKRVCINTILEVIIISWTYIKLSDRIFIAQA